MNHMWVIGAFFKKWVIVYYSRMESKFQNLKPYNIYFNHADFKFLDQNLRSWPSFEKLSPTFFATSNFETRLSRDPITWHPEVRCFGYKMTHFIILPPQKNFSRTLQILGFIAESGHYKKIFNLFLSIQTTLDTWWPSKYNVLNVNTKVDADHLEFLKRLLTVWNH